MYSAAYHTALSRGKLPEEPEKLRKIILSTVQFFSPARCLVAAHRPPRAPQLPKFFSLAKILAGISEIS
jgi:hypothetical protein